jgi:ankyrin repeat protein
MPMMKMLRRVGVGEADLMVEDHVNRTPLSYAIENGHIDMARYLL